MKHWDFRAEEKKLQKKLKKKMLLCTINKKIQKMKKPIISITKKTKLLKTLTTLSNSKNNKSKYNSSTKRTSTKSKLFNKKFHTNKIYHKMNQINSKLKDLKLLFKNSWTNRSQIDGIQLIVL